MGLDSNLFTHHMCSQFQRSKSTENAVQAYLSGILAHKGRSVATLSDNGTEFKTFSMKHAISWILKGYSSIHFIHKEMQEWKMSIIF